MSNDEFPKELRRKFENEQLCKWAEEELLTSAPPHFLRAFIDEIIEFRGGFFYIF